MLVGEQRRDRDVGDVVARHRGHAPVARRAADDAVGAREERHEVEVDRVAQEREADAGVADQLLGVEVVAAEGEGAIGRRAQERGVDEALDARRDRGLDRRAVQRIHAVGVLAGRGQEEDVDAVERAPHRLAVVVAGRLHDLGARERGRPRRVAHDQPLLDAALGQPGGDAAPEPAGGARDADHAAGWLAPSRSA